MTRERTVADLESAADEYLRDGYAIVTENDRYAIVRDRDHGSVVAHLVLFFTVGWLTFGVLNLIYALYRRGKSDTVRLELDD